MEDVGKELVDGAEVEDPRTDEGGERCAVEDKIVDRDLSGMGVVVAGVLSGVEAVLSSAV